MTSLRTSDKIIAVIGGSGFVGRYVVRLLAHEGYRVRVICRTPESARFLKTAGDVGQVVVTGGNLTRFETIVDQLNGVYGVVNLAGVLYESGNQKFHEIHAQGAERLAKAAKSAGCKMFVHVSALGVDKATTSAYARSKVLGEKAVRGAFHDAVILRPSVIFGPEDNFFNQFARMASLGPALPLIGGGKTLFQPVYVGDVAQAIVTCLKHPQVSGKTFELGGPDAMSFYEILEYIQEQLDTDCTYIRLPFGLAGTLGFACEFLPAPPLTRDQVRLLKYDNIVSPDVLGFNDLGITPVPISAIVPRYLARYAPQAQVAA